MNIGRMRNGAILISAGVVLLLNTTGHLFWPVWVRIFSLWPVALIAIGIELLFKKTRVSFLTILSPLLFLAAILGPAFFYDSDIGKIYRASQEYHWSEDLDSTLTEAKVTVRLNAGNLKISSDSDKLVSAELEYFKKEPLLVYERINLDRSALVKITDRERKWLEWNLSKGRFLGAWDEKSWEVRLTDLIPIDLRVYVKASEADMDFSDLKIRDFDLEAKASDVDIKIGDLTEKITARVESKAARLTIFLPEDMGLSVENHTNLSSTSFSWLTLKEIDNTYQTPDFDQAPQKLTLYLEGSLTKLKIKRYQPFEGI